MVGIYNLSARNVELLWLSGQTALPISELHVQGETQSLKLSLLSVIKPFLVPVNNM